MVDVHAFDSLAAFLAAHYEELKESGQEPGHQRIANAIGMSDSYVGALHRGRADTAVRRWQGKRAHTFLKAHLLTTQEIRRVSEHFGLTNVLEYLDMQGAGAPRPVREGGELVKFMGAVSAGRFGEVYADDGGEYVDIPRHVLRHHDAADVFALKVTGDSMVSDDARGSIPPGAIAYFHSVLRPSPGAIICARLERDDMSVLKVYRPGEPFTTLGSLNGKHRPIIIDDDNPATVEGVLIGTSIPF